MSMQLLVYHVYEGYFALSNGCVHAVIHKYLSVVMETIMLK